MGRLLKRALLGLGGGSLNIAELFSVDTFTGAQTLINNIDLSSGGMFWGKARAAATSHQLYDTERGATKKISSDLTAAESTDANGVTSFNSDGVTVGSSFGGSQVGWSFKKAPRFLDVIKYTGNGANRVIPHALGVQAGLVLVKKLISNKWIVQHVSRGGGNLLVLNESTAESTGATIWNNTAADAAGVSLGSNANVNSVGDDFVMYVYAHDIAGNGVIQCGSYTGNGTLSNNVNLAAPWAEGIQYLMIKRAAGGNGSWLILDTSRGLGAGSDQALYADTTASEVGGVDWVDITANGFEVKQGATAVNASGSDYIYMAIRAEA